MACVSGNAWFAKLSSTPWPTCNCATVNRKIGHRLKRQTQTHLPPHQTNQITSPHSTTQHLTLPYGIVTPEKSVYDKNAHIYETVHVESRLSKKIIRTKKFTFGDHVHVQEYFHTDHPLVGTVFYLIFSFLFLASSFSLAHMCPISLALFLPHSFQRGMRGPERGHAR